MHFWRKDGQGRCFKEVPLYHWKFSYLIGLQGFGASLLWMKSRFAGWGGGAGRGRGQTGEGRMVKRPQRRRRKFSSAHSR